MAYRVSLAAPAETDAYAAFERIREAAPMHAEKWLTRLFEAIFSLDELPARCPVIPEAKELGFPARHLLYGKGRGVYRIIFHIREDEQHVRVLRVWHGFPRCHHRRRRGGLTIPDFIAYYRVSTGPRSQSIIDASEFRKSSILARSASEFKPLRRQLHIATQSAQMYTK